MLRFGRIPVYASPAVAVSTPAESRIVYRFEPYEVDAARGELRKFGNRIRLERKPWLLLLVLLESRGALVTRGELQAALWSDGTFVDFEHGLYVAVKKLRAALCDSTDSPRFIETVAGEGYRFIADVQEAVSPVGASAQFTHASSSEPAQAAIPALPATVPTSRSRQHQWWFAVVVVVGIAFLSFVLAGRWGRRTNTAQPAPAGKVMLVVLPFQNLSGDPSQEYLSDGMTEELSAQLGNLEPDRLGVIGRTSAMTYKDSHGSIGEIGKQLGVDYVLEGSVRREGNKLRVTAQLIEVSSQAHVWSESYDRDMGDLLQVEADVAGSIEREVGLSIALARPRVPAPRMPNPEAHEEYLRGRYCWNRRAAGDWVAAEQHFRRAIQLDPQYALAYAGLAECRVGIEEASAAARRAVELDPASAEARIALGWVELYRSLDVAAGGRAFHSAVQLDPNYAPAHHSYGEYLAMVGRFEEALAEKRQAMILDPLSVRYRGALAALLALAGHDEAALKEVQKELELRPDSPLTHVSTAQVHLTKGRYSEAIRELQIHAKHADGPEWGLLGYAYARSGNKKQASEILRELPKHEGTSTLDAAMVEIGLGHNEEALRWLERCNQARDDSEVLWLNVYPMYQPLRSEPRFQALLRKMNFPNQ